jgi:rod shape determining protein RodA
VRREDKIFYQIDWTLVLLFFTMVTLGWLNIFAAVYDEEVQQNIFDFNINSGRQLVWIGFAVFLILTILVLDFKFFDSFGYILYGLSIALLIAVLIFGKEIAGSKSWFVIGPARLQPSEFAKFTTAIAMAKYLGSIGVKLDRFKDFMTVAAIITAPVLLIMLQGDTGTAMVFAILIIPLYREGLNPIFPILGISAATIFLLTLLIQQLYLFIGIAALSGIIIALGKKSVKRISLVLASALLVAGVIFSVDYVVTNVMKPHQQNRLKALVDPGADPLGYGWNVTQSKIAIGSGGLSGKGFLEGTQTKFDFVPEQSTDFIFCTIGEEHGWIGSLVLIGLFVTMLVRIVIISERQKSNFARIYGYSVAAFIFFHFGVNIAMTIGLFPVVGIPLPFFSYGGSSLWSFTILLFVLIKLDAHRNQVLTRF